MEGEEEEEPFGSLVKLVEVTASQEEKLQNCPFARDSDKCPETETDLNSLLASSQHLISPRPTPIIMVSLPDSEGSTDRNTQDKYHTPPEHSLSVASDSDPPPPLETTVLGGEDDQTVAVDLGEDVENPGLQLGGNLDDENSRRKRSSQQPTETTWCGGDVDGPLQLDEKLESFKGNEGGKQTAKSPATTMCGGDDDLVAERAVDFGIPEEALGYLGTQLDRSLCGECCDCVIRDHDTEVLGSITDTERVLKGEYCQNVAKKIRVSEGDLRLGMCSLSSSDRTQRVEDLDTKIVDVDAEECHGNLGSDKQRLLITVGTVKKAIGEGVKLREKGEDCGWGNKGWSLLKNLHKTGLTGLDIRRNENLDSDGERSVWAGKGEKLGENDAKGRGICGEVENLCGNSEGKGDASEGRNLHLNGLMHGDHKGNGNLGSNGEGSGRNGKGKILGESGEAVGGYGKAKVLQENDDRGGGSREGKNSCKNGRGNDGTSRDERLRKNSESVVKFREDNLDKNKNGEGAANALRKAVKAIEKFKYASSCDGMKHRGKARGVLGKQELPLSMLGQIKGNPKEMESKNEGTKVRSFTDLLDSLKLVVRNADDGSEPDFLETAKRRGMVFPRPRWWSPERVD